MSYNVIVAHCNSSIALWHWVSQKSYNWLQLNRKRLHTPVRARAHVRARTRGGFQKGCNSVVML